MVLKSYTCKTLEDVYNLLEEKVIPIYGSVEELINGQIWMLKWQFTQSFLYNNIYFNKLTNKYAYHIIDSDEFNYGYNCIYFNFPNMGQYSTYAELLEGVSKKLYKLWKLDTTEKYKAMDISKGV